MAITMTDVRVAQMACLEVGMNPITAFSDGSAEATLLELHYPTIVGNEITIFNWRFTTGQEELSRLAASPDARWEAAYQIPGTFKTVKAVTVNDLLIDYKIYGDKVFCDVDAESAVFADGRLEIGEDLWPDYFTRLIVLRLARLLASGIAEKVTMAKQLNEEAEVQLRRARNTDSKANSTSRIRTRRIVPSRKARLGLGSRTYT